MALPHARLRRILWTIPAMVFGVLLVALCFLFFLGPITVLIAFSTPWLSFLPLLFGWIFFAIPFAWFVPTESRLYQFPLAPVFGGLLGMIAFGVYLLFHIAVSPEGLPQGEFSLLPLALTLSVISGVGFASAMSLWRYSEMKRNRLLQSV